MNDDTNHNRRDHSHDGHSGPADGIHPAVELLSEYLDQAPELAQAERDAIDRHLIGCEQCRRTLSELQLMVRTLGSLPEMKVPRSFALHAEARGPATTPERRAPVVLQESAQWHERHAGKVRWATAVAVMLFAFVISADFVTNNLSGTADMATNSRQMEVMRATEATPAAAAADPGVPTIEIEPKARTTGDEAPAADDEVPESANSTAAEDEPDAGTFMAPSDEAETGNDAGKDEAAVTMSQEDISDEPAPETQASADSGRVRWRIAEVSLALLVAILLTVMIGLPKQRGR